MGTEIYHNLKGIINQKYGQGIFAQLFSCNAVDATNVGDEGGFAPNIQSNKEGLELLKQAIAKGKLG